MTHLTPEINSTPDTKKYELNAASIGTMHHILQMFNAGKEADAQIAFQKFIETTQQPALPEAQEDNEHSIAGIASKTAKEYKKYIEILKWKEVTVWDNLYKFNDIFHGLVIYNATERKTMMFSMNPEKQEAFFEFEKGDEYEKNMKLVFDIGKSRTEKFEKYTGNKTTENAFAKAMSEKILEILPLAVIELAKQEATANEQNIEDLKNSL